MSRAQRIVDEIRGSDRYSQLFGERVFTEEPILRTGADAFRRRDVEPRTPPDAPGPKADEPLEDRVLDDEIEQLIRTIRGQDTAPVTKRDQFRHDEPLQTPLPPEIIKLRAMGHFKWPGSFNYLYGVQGEHFYKQAKVVESCTDDFELPMDSNVYLGSYASYDRMSDVELRLYFTWRTHLRAKDHRPARLEYLYLHTYELLCGIVVEPGPEGFEALRDLGETYRGMSTSFDSQLVRWMNDYVIFWGLDPALVREVSGSFDFNAVAMMKRAQEALIAAGATGQWAQSHRQAYEMGLPDADELLDAMCSVSRYRGERSRFIKDHHADVALVAARVFARMVAHCHKRRKTGYVEGMFGDPVRVSHTVFPGAMFWAPGRHEDVSVKVSDTLAYVCENGFWYRIQPCRRVDTNRELGNLLHTIDCRMRVAFADPHKLKERSIAKYQGKFIDEEIAAFLAQRKAEEDARIRIDLGSLSEIRSAAERTRDALLTDDDRADDEAWRDGGTALSVPAAGPEVETSSPQPEPEGSATIADGVPFDARQREILEALLAGTQPVPSGTGAFLSLEVDAINEVFLDLVGDTVIEFADDEAKLVVDYAEDVEEALGRS